MQRENPLTLEAVSLLIAKHGESTAREIILNYLSDESKLPEIACFFPQHVTLPLPQHQFDILSTIPTTSRLGVAAPRGSGKSTIVDVIVLAYYLLFSKSKFALMISDTDGQVKLQFNALQFELENNPYIRWLFGDVKGDTWGVEFMVVRTRFGESAIMTRSVGQKVRGLKWRHYRPDLAVIDDLENDQSVRSPMQRQQLEDWFKRVLLPSFKPTGNKIIMLGTILHGQAIIKKIISKLEEFGGWTSLLYKAITDKGESYWPEIYPLQFLLDIRDNPKHERYVGLRVFLTEYQNEPPSGADSLIKNEWIVYYNRIQKPEIWYSGLRIIGAVDPAISDKDGSSFFVFHTIGVDTDGHKWVLDTKRGKFTILEQIKIILDSYETWEHEVIGVESIAYQKVLSQLLRVEAAKRGIYPKIKEIYTDKSKERRMEVASAQFQGGFIHLDQGHPETVELVNEILVFPVEPNDNADCLLLGLELTTTKKKRTFGSKPNGM
jgi:hypothetical protein